MTEIAYSVTARCPSQDVARAFIDWLAGGHAQAVLRGGATRATIAASVEPEDPHRVEVRYMFPDQAAFETYVERHAPALRAEGIERFGPASGVEFSRTIGRVEAQIVEG